MVDTPGMAKRKVEKERVRYYNYYYYYYYYYFYDNYY